MACNSRIVCHSERIWSKSCRGKGTAYSVFCALLFLGSVMAFEIIKHRREISPEKFFLTCPLFDARTGDASRRVVSTVLLKV